MDRKTASEILRNLMNRLKNGLTDEQKMKLAVAMYKGSMWERYLEDWPDLMKIKTVDAVAEALAEAVKALADGNTEESKQGREPAGNGFGVCSGSCTDKSAKNVAKHAEKKLCPGAYGGTAFKRVLHGLLSLLLGFLMGAILRFLFG